MATKERDRSETLRRVAVRLGLLLGSLLALFCVAEGSLRLLGVKPKTTSVLSAYFQPHPILGWFGRPNAKFQFTTDNFDSFISHDTDGLRQSGLAWRIEADDRHPGDVVWCVGDSVIYSWGVEDGRTIVDHLNRSSTDDRAFRNLGVPGYSPLQEYLLLKSLFDRGCKPDHVLVQFWENDLHDNLSPSMTGPRFEIVEGRAVQRPCPPLREHNWKHRSWLKDHLRTYNYLNYYTGRAKHRIRSWAGRSKSRTTARKRAHLDQQSKLIALRASYALIKELCAQHNVSLTIVSPYDNKPPLEQVCAELSIPLLSIAKYVEQRSVSKVQRKPVTFKTDPHWNNLGNQLAAEGIRAEFGRSVTARATFTSARR